MNTVSALRMRRIITCMDRALMAMNSVPTIDRPDMEYSRAIGALEYARDALLEAAVGHVAVEPASEPERVS